jgi:hypothetical protein
VIAIFAIFDMACAGLLSGSRGQLSAVTVHKLLYGAEWCVVFFAFMPNEGKRRTELGVQLARPVPHDWQATALDWTIFGKGSDDDVTARFDRSKHCVDIGFPVFFACQKVKDRAVVPNIEGVNRKHDLCNVSFGPLHFSGSLAKASLCDR